MILLWKMLNKLYTRPKASESFTPNILILIKKKKCSHAYKLKKLDWNTRNLLNLKYANSIYIIQAVLHQLQTGMDKLSTTSLIT